MMKVRDGDISDLSETLELIEDMGALMRHHAGADAERFSVDRSKSARRLGGVLGVSTFGNDDLFCKVLDDGERLQGLVIAERLPDLWMNAKVVVEHVIFIRPAFWGSFAAGKLLLQFKQWAEAIPGTVVRVHAEAGPTNEKARRAFNKLGWAERGTVHGVEVH